MHDCENDKNNKYFCYNCNPEIFLNDEESSENILKNSRNTIAIK